MNVAKAPGSLAITGYSNLFNGATLTFYTGSAPSTPETTASGTALCTFTFGSPGFATLSTTGSYDSLSGSLGSYTYITGGTAGYARATMATPSARANTTAYTRGNLVTASSNLYVCIAPGTTSGTSTLTTATYGIVDGTAAFDYVGASTVTALADYTVSTSGADINLSTTTIASGVTVAVASFLLQVATV